MSTHKKEAGYLSIVLILALVVLLLSVSILGVLISRGQTTIVPTSGNVAPPAPSSSEADNPEVLTDSPDFTNSGPDFAAAGYGPNATFTTPGNGSSQGNNKVQIKLKVKAGQVLVNELVQINFLVANQEISYAAAAGPQFAYMAYSYGLTNVFKTPTEEKEFTLNNFPLLYGGNNYITCFLQDDNGNAHFCGGDDEEDEFDQLRLNYTGALNPLYRFFSSSKGGHFYTANHVEAQGLKKQGTGWSFESIGYYVNQKTKCNSNNGKPVYRFYSNRSQSHFYTINEAEKNSIIANDPNWSFEGYSFCGIPTQVTNSFPVYRFYKQSLFKHFFTISEAEKNNLIATDASWKFETKAYYGFK